MPWKGGSHIARSRAAAGHVRRFKRLASGIFARQADAFKAASQAAHDADDLQRAIDASITSTAPAWRTWHRRCYVIVGADYAEAALPKQRAKRAAGDQDVDALRAQLGKEAWWDTWLALTLRYADTQSAQKIQGIDEATRHALRRQITRGLEAGDSVDDIRRRIDGVLRSAHATVRAERIARTEVPTAARAGAWQAPIAYGIEDELVKSWTDSGDRLVRATHEEATAENAGIGYLDAFRVRSPSTGAVQLLNFPGDTSLGADASNVVNCRCDSFTDRKR